MYGSKRICEIWKVNMGFKQNLSSHKDRRKTCSRNYAWATLTSRNTYDPISTGGELMLGLGKPAYLREKFCFYFLPRYFFFKLIFSLVNLSNESCWFLLGELMRWKGGSLPPSLLHEVWRFLSHIPNLLCLRTRQRDWRPALWPGCGTAWPSLPLGMATQLIVPVTDARCRKC